MDDVTIVDDVAFPGTPLSVASMLAPLEVLLSAAGVDRRAQLERMKLHGFEMPWMCEVRM